MTSNIHDITRSFRIVPPVDNAFVNENDEPIPFLPAPEIDRIGQHLIAECPELAHLTTASIAYLWKRAGGKASGRLTLGRTVLAPALLTFFDGYQFVIWVAADNSRDLALNAMQFEALMFSQLMRADIDPETAKPALRSPEVVAFTAEIARYGAWTSELKDARETFVQAPLIDQVVPFTSVA